MTTTYNHIDTDEEFTESEILRRVLALKEAADALDGIDLVEFFVDGFINDDCELIVQNLYVQVGAEERQFANKVAVISTVIHVDTDVEVLKQEIAKYESEMEDE